MISIVYHKKYNALTMDGHAGSGEPGQDLVCAAASAVAYTLAGNVRQLEAQGALRDCVVDMGSGHAQIRCTACTHSRATVRLVFGAVCMGFAMLAQEYPEFVNLDVLE